MKKTFKKLFIVCTLLFVGATVCSALGIAPTDSILADMLNVLSPNGGIMLGLAAGVVGPGTSTQGGLERGAATEDYFDEDLDRTIVKVRPSDTPLDTFTRNLGNVESVSDLEPGGWEIGTRDVVDKVTTATTAAAALATISVEKIGMWQPNDVIKVEGVAGKDGQALCLYCVGIGDDGNSIKVKAVNGTSNQVPVIDENATLLRLSTGVSEKTAQASAWNNIPSNRKNYCQIHMAQVEESVIHRLQKKKVAMDFSTAKEQSIWEMKRAMELQNLWGVKGTTTNAKGEIVYLSAGIWEQMAYTSTINKAGLTDAEYTALFREIFDNNNGSDRRVLFAGSGLIEVLSTVKNYQKQLEPQNVEIVQGVRVNKIVTPFGEALIKPMGPLFSGVNSMRGMCVDLSYVKKFVFEPLQTKVLDLDSSGQSRVNAIRLHETYCLFLENLPVHRKIIAQ